MITFKENKFEWSGDYSYLASVKKIFKNWAGHFHENDFVRNTSGETRFLSFRAGFDNNQSLLLYDRLRWWFNCEVKHLTSWLINEQKVCASSEVTQGRSKKKLSTCLNEKRLNSNIKKFEVL